MIGCAAVWVVGGVRVAAGVETAFDAAGVVLGAFAGTSRTGQAAAG